MARFGASEVRPGLNPLLVGHTCSWGTGLLAWRSQGLALHWLTGAQKAEHTKGRDDDEGAIGGVCAGGQ